MKLPTRLVLHVLLLSAAAGCPATPAQPPASPAEYDRFRQTNRQAYPPQTIVMFNLQRVLNGQLSAKERLESMQLVIHLGGDDTAVREQLAGVLAEPNCPPALSEAVLQHLLKSDYPGLAGYVVRVLPQLQERGPLQEAILEWLANHPTPEVLSEIVRLWAAEPSAVGINEPRYRLIVQRITGNPWDQALVDGLNNAGFSAHGAAIGILAQRITPKALADRIFQLKANTDTVVALQTFVYRFDYVPTNADEMATVESLYKARTDMFREAGTLFSSWRQAYGYAFRLRDFHLLSRLARDPLRTSLRRTQLILDLGQSFTARKYPPPQGRALYDDRFWMQASNLGITDLWNLYLLNEMLTRPRVQLALRLVAQQDREDTAAARGGLIFYENGMAEATLYPPQPGQSNDKLYVPGEQGLTDGRDALCRFHGHFEKAKNLDRIGPSAEELQAAKEQVFYGLVLTSIDDDTFCAHYYNPTGAVVSLGMFPFGK